MLWLVGVGNMRSKNNRAGTDSTVESVPARWLVGIAGIPLSSYGPSSSKYLTMRASVRMVLEVSPLATLVQMVRAGSKSGSSVT
jgi:hypothetical protein